MMKVMVSVWVAFSVLLMASSARAAPPDYESVPRLVSAADLIVVGHVVPLEEQLQSKPRQANSPFTPDRLLIFTVTPDRVLKGSLPGGSSTITIEARVSIVSAPVESYGVFFLRPVGSGLFEPALSDFSSVVAVPWAASVIPGTDPLLAVAEELAAVLATPADTLAEIHDRSDAVTPLLDAQRLYSKAHLAISDIPVAVARAPLEAALASDPDVLSRSWIISNLIEMGVPASLDSVKPFLEAQDPDTELTRQSVISAFTYEHIPPELIPSIIEFLGSSNIALRRAAAQALRNERTVISTRALASTALRDDDPKVRAFAESGLCWAMKLRTPPCDVPAERNEVRQHAYWTQWAVTNGLQ
jgi:hypothetical protein